ncbi:MAG: DUF4097 family beta strand repeat-containing protein [Gemmatimonadota bacterium]
MAMLSGLSSALAGAPGAHAQETVDTGMAIDAGAAIKVWNGGGAVRVEGWAADSIHVTGEVEIGEFFLLGADQAAKLGLQGPERDVRARLTVRVPASASVWIRTAGAEATVRDMEGSLDVHTVAGAIDVEGRPADLYAESMGGDVRLVVETGVVRARTGTGRLTLEGTVEDLTLSTVSGSLEARVPDLRRGSMSSVDGDVRFAGSVRRGGSLTLETHSGDAGLRVPGDLAADVELSTFEGRIRAPLGGAVRAPSVRTEGEGATVARFELEGGGAEVTVRSYSGSIEAVAD